MRQLDTNGTFYREQALANLSFLFGCAIDILTCQKKFGGVIAFAYKTRRHGKRFKIMQAYNSDLVKALQALHGMSCKRLGELTAECNHEEDLAECCVPLPAQIRCLSEDDVVSIDTIPLDEEPEALEAEHGLTVGQEERIDPTTEPLPQFPQTDLTPSVTVASHAVMKGYPVLVDIQYPFKGPIGALRYMERPSRHILLQVVAQVLAANEPPNDPSRFLKSLGVRKGNATYDVLGYPQDDIGSLLDDILNSEELLKIECVYSI